MRLSAADRRGAGRKPDKTRKWRKIDGKLQSNALFPLPGGAGVAYGDRSLPHRLAPWSRPVEVLDKAHFVEHTKSGYATYFTVTACQPPRFWAFTMENSSMAGRWEGRFQAADGGTWLTCAETITAKRWWMRPFVPGYLKRQQKLYLDDLQKELRKESPRLFNEA